MAEKAGDWLKRQRIRAGLRKQDALATAVGVSRGAVGNWESNRGGPGPANVPALAAALGVTQAEVINAFGIPMHGELRAPMPPWWDELRGLISGLDDRLRSLEGELAAQRVAQLTSDREQIAEVLRQVLRDELGPAPRRRASGQNG